MSRIQFLHVVDQWLYSIGRPAAEPDVEDVVLLEFPSGGAFTAKPGPDGQLEMSASVGVGDSCSIRDIAQREEAEEDSSPSLHQDSLAVLAWSDEGGLWQLEASPADARMFLVWESSQPESLSDWTQAVKDFEAACGHWHAG